MTDFNFSEDDQLFNLIASSPSERATLATAILRLQQQQQLKQQQLQLYNANNLLRNLFYTPNNRVSFTNILQTPSVTFDNDAIGFDRKARHLEYPIPRHVQEWLMSAAVKIFKAYCKRNSRFPPCKLLALSHAAAAAVAASK